MANKVFVFALQFYRRMVAPAGGLRHLHAHLILHSSSTDLPQREEYLRHTKVDWFKRGQPEPR